MNFQYLSVRTGSLTIAETQPKRCSFFQQIFDHLLYVKDCFGLLEVQWAKQKNQRKIHIPVEPVLYWGREREREEGRKGEKINSIVNKISANKGKNFGRKEMVTVREFETVSREAREDLTARLLTSFGYFLEWDQAMYSRAICQAKGGANAKALSWLVQGQQQASCAGMNCLSKLFFIFPLHRGGLRSDLT